MIFQNIFHLVVLYKSLSALLNFAENDFAIIYLIKSYTQSTPLEKIFESLRDGVFQPLNRNLMVSRDGLEPSTHSLKEYYTRAKFPI